MSDALINSMFGSYKLTAVLGRGGMATVYRGYQEAVDRYVAVKVLPAELMHDASFAARFTNEARTLARLTHPAILPLYDFGNANGMPYIVMPLMTGGSLADKVARGPMPVSEIGRIFTPIAQALDFAHRQNVLHRDVKPNNILFDQHDNPFLSDFGIAKAMEGASTLTGTGVIGTPDYMSPEQARGEQIDGRSDVYSLGVVAYQSLTGHQLFQATTPMGVIFKHATEAPRPLHEVRPDIPLSVEKVILRALAKNPSERYQTATEFAQALMAVISTVNNVGASLGAGANMATYVSEGPFTPPPPPPPANVYSGTPRPPSPADPLQTLLPTEEALNNPAAYIPAARLVPPIAPKKSNTGLIVGGILVAALCLIAVCGLGGYYVATQTTCLDNPGLECLALSQATPTPDASTKLIAFVSNRDGNNEIYVMNADGSNQTRLTMDDADDGDPAWSIDGKTIFFASNRDGDFDIYSTSSDGANLTKISNEDGDEKQPWAAPDGKRLVFWGSRDDSEGDVYVLDMETKEVVNLTNSPGVADRHPVVSPDGTKIVLRSDPNGNPDIIVVNIDGSNQVNLTNNPAWDSSPAWSPDGSLIVFTTDRDGKNEVYLMSADGSNLQRLTNNTASENSATWSPDGKSIVFFTDRDGNIELYDMVVDGSHQTQLTNNPADDITPAWQPFGK